MLPGSSFYNSRQYILCLETKGFSDEASAVLEMSFLVLSVKAIHSFRQWFTHQTPFSVCLL